MRLVRAARVQSECSGRSVLTALMSLNRAFYFFLQNYKRLAVAELLHCPPPALASGNANPFASLRARVGFNCLDEVVSTLAAVGDDPACFVCGDLGDECRPDVGTFDNQPKQHSAFGQCVGYFPKRPVAAFLDCGSYEI